MSTNDAVSALFWCLMAETRGRPLPGHRPHRLFSSAASAEDPSDPASSLCMTLDLRRNGLQAAGQPELFGNAAWCIHVDACSAKQAAAGESQDMIMN